MRIAWLALSMLACGREATPGDGARGPTDGPAARDTGSGADRGDVASVGQLDAAGAAAGCLAAPSLDRIRGWMQSLTGEQPVTLDGREVRLGERASVEGRARARAFLRAEYEALGYTVADQAYPTGVNLTASRAGDGRATGLLIIGAHYDTVTDTVGADDNASGLVASLGAALALRGCTLDRELQILAYDQEEDGLIGSRAHVGKLRAEGKAASVLGMLNVDMMGYDSDGDGGYTIFECDRPESLFLVDALLAETRALALPLRADRQCVGGGDHRSFWDGRIPAVAFGEQYGRAGADVNPCYHKACDRLDRINLGYLTHLTHLTAATVRQLLSGR